MKKLERDVHVERYFPDVLAPAKEMKAIAAGEDPKHHQLYEKAWNDGKACSQLFQIQMNP